MRQAIGEALIAQHEGEVPVGAVIVANNKIIGRGHNLTETLGDVTAHAEMQAITAASNWLGGKYLKDCKIYISLEPCAMCAGALFWTQIAEVHFAAPDERKGFTTIKEPLLHPRTTLTKGLLASESISLLKQFFLDRR